ncbi:class I SAM-dependent DNA methyltransferase [Pannonibacter tanglangensis]|uniref:site-specific DNA-methyltransferase (adenine-specific) n=1 Tax=Pannonibacter tanglangensis TaxID=2750084 RepID=A0ABW9ZGS8_9HYPH|nr:DNA methyltransferase [Pannonibacter sp. XCT-34]NBN64055.1 lactate dehydrogenase [Pannonibacter sp. XCT-34]
MMNPTEIADALDGIARATFDPATFGYAFAEATDNAEATVAKLKAGTTNKSDVPGGVLLNGKFHFAPALPGKATEMLDTLRASKRTAKAKPAILIATDGEMIAAEHPKSGETLHCAFLELGTQFAFFLPAAGKERYRAAEENPVDIKATGKLAKLYDALLKTNPEWARPERRHAMNLFMTRLIFCLFSEDVGVFKKDQFSQSVFSYSGNKGEHAREVLIDIFAAMNLPKDQRSALPAWTHGLEYVNGGLFADDIDAPAFNPVAFSYLREAADLKWEHINPDIFGSMIQSIADPKARAELGMHYTSVPNIMKVLGPLFLDDLDEALAKAWDKPSQLKILRERLSKIRVFDPACGSGNFLVVAYREMREREIRILKRLDDLEGNKHFAMFSSVSLNQFYGIELTDFAAETAKLALFIAEYQANARFADVFGRMPALLPLRDGGQIRCGNALRLDWDEVCPPPAGDEEVYIAGNPPFLGKARQEQQQKESMDLVFRGRMKTYRAFDLVAAWYFLAAQYIQGRNAEAALVATNSICQGASASTLWPEIFKFDIEIGFAHRSFKWRNNAAANAAVICVIVGIRNASANAKRLIDDDFEVRAANINSYLVDGPTVTVSACSKPINGLPEMTFGEMPRDGGHLILSQIEMETLTDAYPMTRVMIRKFLGSEEVVNGLNRYCLWIDERADPTSLDLANSIPLIKQRFKMVAENRLKSTNKSTSDFADRPHRFVERRSPETFTHAILIPSVTSERRPYLPVDRVSADVISSNLNQVLYDAPDWCIALIASRLHLVWIATVCGKLKSDFRYSNTLGWNTFPVPKFTDEQLDELSASARRILKTRYQHYPKTIAELYDPDKMPEDLRAVHRENDELLETMYIGRPFRNDTERLEKLFQLYAARVRQGAK